MAALADKRCAREAAQADLRQMTILRAVIASVISDKNEGLYRTLERDLLKAACIEQKEDPRAAVGNLARRLQKKH